MKKLVACLALSFAFAAHADTTLDYNVLHAGKKSGAQKTVIGNDGRMHVTYSYRDNGRGPDIEEDITLAARRHDQELPPAGQDDLRRSTR